MSDSYTKFSSRFDGATLLRCPICARSLFLEGRSLRCANGHTFDISAKGSVDLRRKAVVLDHYTSDFFKARRRVFERGLYSRLGEALKGLIAHVCEDFPQKDSPVILDAGCGEGYFSRLLGATIGLDLAIDGIRVASRGGGSCQWVCADLAAMPVRDDCVDVVLNIFSPAQYRQFERVSRQGRGFLIKVIPGPHHMEELRRLVGLGGATDSSSSLELLSEHAQIVQKLECAQKNVITDLSEARMIAAMSPVAFGHALSDAELKRLTSITVDSTVLLTRLV